MLSYLASKIADFIGIRIFTGLPETASMKFWQIGSDYIQPRLAG
jgi:hypothetical protein